MSRMTLHFSVAASHSNRQIFLDFATTTRGVDGFRYVYGGRTFSLRHTSSEVKKFSSTPE